MSARAAFNLVVPVIRSDAEKREVYGFLSVARDAAGATVTDSHGSQISVEELDRMAHRYLVEARGVGEQHERFDGIGHVIESVVFTREKQAAIPPKGIPEGHVHEGWWVGFRVDDPDTWGRLKRGELTGLSIGGWAKRVPGAVARSAAGAPDAPPVHQLTDLEIVEGSLVDAPANPLCMVALFKRAGAARSPATPETPRMFEKLTAAIKSMVARVSKEDAPAAPPSMDALLMQDAFLEQWEALQSAYSESCWRIYDAGLALPDMLAALAESTTQFLTHVEELRAKLGAGASALDVVQMDAALSACLHAASGSADREALGASIKDLTATVKNLAPRRAGNTAGTAAPTESTMNDTEVAKAKEALELEKAARVKAETELAKARAEKEAAEKAQRDAVEKAESEAIRKRAEKTLPGLSTADMEALLRSVKGTPADALVQAAVDASDALLKKLSAPVGEGGTQDAATEATRWEQAVSDVAKRDGLNRADAIRKAMAEQPELWRAHRKADRNAESA